MAVSLKKDTVAKTYHMFKVKDIRVEENFNVRLETPELKAHIEWLKDNIKEHGVKDPVTLRKKGTLFVLSNGHCRFRACTELNAEGFEIRIPAIIEDLKVVSEADRIAALMIQNSGLPLTLPEQSEVVKRLIKYGLSDKEIATKISKSVSHVNHLYKYLELPEEVKGLVVDGSVSPSAAIKTAYEEGEKVTEVLQAAKDEAKADGKSKATKKHIDKAKVKTKKSGPIVITKITPIHVGLFKAVYKYAETLIGENDYLANALTDDCLALEKQIEEYEESIKPEVEDTEED